jgi:protein TonB
VVQTLAAPPPPVFVAPVPPPPQAVVAVAPPAAPAPNTVTATDLSSTRVAGKTPRYPIESRRKHEQGVVTLSLTLATDGSVARIAVAQSSGFARLDKAALEAVRGWRWLPMLRAGQPVMVRALLEIPFVLN